MVSPTSKTQHRSPLVVVGAGMAAHALLRRLELRGGLDQYDVTLIGEEPRLCYDRVNLTESFSGKTPEDLLLSPPEWYAEHSVRVFTGARLTAVHRAERTVETDTGEALRYDHLVLATGSRPFVPPLEGADLPGVFVYRTIEDIERIRAYAGERRTAAVLGGGLLGLEAAKALHDLGLQTHVAEVAAGLMPRQLNTEAGALLKEEIESLGVQVHLQRRAERIEAHGDERVLHFAGHAPLTVDMVVVSAGIRPRDELADEAGLEVGPRGGVVVDTELRTSDPQIFAIGECACYENKLFGLVGPCYDMAHVVADNLVAMAAGQATEATFAGGSSAARLKLMGVDVATLGTPIGEAAGATAVISRGDDYCRTLLVENRRVVGAIGVGEWPERERLSGAIAAGRRITNLQRRRFMHTGLAWPNVEREAVTRWPAKATVCSCLNVTRGELSQALVDGATDADELAASTGASTVCGSCRDLLCELAGQPEAATRARGRWRLLGGSTIALAALALVFAVGPLPSAATVQSTWRGIDALWRDSFAKQVSGYSLLAISVVALALSLRKRVSWISLGDFGSWRGAHGLIGSATLVGFLIHTGMRLGHNFTFALAATFLLLNLLGAFTGMTAALEASSSGVLGRRLRAWRPRLTQLHIWLFWPLPVLVAFHIISVYYY